MARILFYQQERLMDSEYLSVNGVRQSPREATEYFKLIAMLADKVIKKSEPWAGAVKNFHFVKGFLEEKDERGRRMTFMYFSPLHELSKKQFIEHMEEDVKVAGKALSKDTLNCLHRYQEKVKTYCYGVVAMILLALALVIIYQTIIKG